MMEGDRHQQEPRKAKNTRHFNSLNHGKLEAIDGGYAKRSTSLGYCVKNIEN